MSQNAECVPVARDDVVLVLDHILQLKPSSPDVIADAYGAINRLRLAVRPGDSAAGRASDWDQRAVLEIARLRVALAAIEALHRPMDEEVELWADGEDPDEHDRRFPECQGCEGHTYTMQVCQECGYTHNGETPAYRPWPCPTLRAAHIDGSDDA